MARFQERIDKAQADYERQCKTIDEQATKQKNLYETDLVNALLGAPLNTYGTSSGTLQGVAQTNK